MSTLQRAFSLPSGDVEFLDSLGRAWETTIEQKARWLLVHGFPVPDGYNHNVVTVALRIQATYPDTEIDMAYFSPALSRADGKSIKALSQKVILGKTYQRWSRHRTPQNPWRPGVDDVSTHLGLVEHWLVSELGK